MKICFAALNAYPAIDARAPGAIGGIETRSWTFANEIARQPDMDVFCAIRHFATVYQTKYADVTIVPLVDRLLAIRHAVATRVNLTPKFPYLKIKQWSWNLLWQMPLLALCRPFKGKRPLIPHPVPTLLENPFDVYLAFGVNTASAEVIVTAKKLGRPVILMLGSDNDMDPIFRTKSDLRDQFGTTGHVGHFVLTNVDFVVAQTVRQQEMLKADFNQDSILIENPIDVATWDSRLIQPCRSETTLGLERFVLWIGRSDDGQKRPQQCLDIANLCPDIDFLMVMNHYDPIVEKRIHRTAPPNVRILDKVPFETMPALFKRAAVLMNTSKLEGFPNTYLQAAVSQVPIASLVVQKDYLESQDLGFCAEGDVEALAQFVRDTWATPRDRARTLAARERVVQRHDLQRLSKTLLDTCLAAIEENRKRNLAVEAGNTSPAGTA